MFNQVRCDRCSKTTGAGRDENGDSDTADIPPAQRCICAHGTSPEAGNRRELTPNEPRFLDSVRIRELAAVERLVTATVGQ